MSTDISLHATGQVIWGFSCLCTAGFLVIYDGSIKQNIQIISSLFIAFLLLQSVTATFFIINDYLQSPVLSYIAAATLTMSGNMYLCMSTILFLSPLHRNKAMRIINIFVIPTLYIAFLIGLMFVSPSHHHQAAYLYYVPCTVVAFLTIIVLFVWFKRERFIFGIYNHSYGNVDDHGPRVHGMANWNLLFNLALVAVVVAALANFVYPALVVYGGVVADAEPGFKARVIDSLLFLPLITPLIRTLDKIVDYSKYRVMQYQIHRAPSMIGDNLNEHSDHDEEEAPLRDL